MNILHIDCSPRPDSHSRGLSAAIVAKLLAARAGARVTRRDLGLQPIPHASADYAAALASRAAQADDAVRLSEELIQEVEAADVLVIGTPMNNFTVPSVLKAWIDQILRIGRTFVSTPEGKVGSLRDRPVYIAVASGGIYTGERANQPDFLTPLMTAAFACIGLKNLHFLPLQATAFRDPAQLAENRDILLANLELA